LAHPSDVQVAQGERGQAHDDGLDVQLAGKDGHVQHHERLGGEGPDLCSHPFVFQNCEAWHRLILVADIGGAIPLLRYNTHIYTRAGIMRTRTRIQGEHRNMALIQRTFSAEDSKTLTHKTVSIGLARTV